jgi:hypothetical protein
MSAGEDETGPYNLSISSSYLLLYLLEPNSVACKMEAASSFKMSEQTYDPTQCNNPEDSNFYDPKITKCFQLTFTKLGWVFEFQHMVYIQRYYLNTKK